ncbi:Sperm surface protein [Trichinella spiralis]|uniref:Sperm surface protein n=1 Tax=Trichinella spiralis TaxID=6334 RepID=A0ABR3KNK6_TRISP
MGEVEDEDDDDDDSDWKAITTTFKFQSRQQTSSSSYSSSTLSYSAFSTASNKQQQQEEQLKSFSLRQFKNAIPPGLRPLLVALAREVLCYRPQDICSFCALFFQTLLQVREEVHDNPLNNKEMYAAFQTTLTKEARRLGLQSSDDKTAAMESVESKATIQQNNSCKVKISSATKIQANIRGYLTRKHLQQEGIKIHHNHNEILHPERGRSMSMDARPERVLSPEEAAVMIQASVRSFLTRKHLEAQGVLYPRKASSQNQQQNGNGQDAISGTV